MYDSVRVQVVQSMNKLLSYLPNFVLREIPIIFKDLKQFPLSKLSDHTELVSSLEWIQE